MPSARTPSLLRARALRPRPLLALSAGALAFGSAAAASAQADLTPPLPNVLLLIDTSGSMEYMADGTLPPVGADRKCLPPAPGQTNLNRWATLVSVLTGTFTNYSCFAAPRDGTAPFDFENEFTFSGVRPYDLGYHLPFHRILSNDCTPGPGNAGTGWPGWPNGAIRFHPWDDPGGTCAAPGFEQAADGLLDTFADRARFGLMTFDTSIDPGTGASGASYAPAAGVQGLWSYFPGWDTAGIGATGNPPACAEHAYEVGARSPAAPPWEGRLMPFGAPDADSVTLAANNEHVQLALLGMRPYGATPLAGMLQDARDFIYNDNATDPVTGQFLSPSHDDYFTGGCRRTYVVVLSDGEPNLDLRREGCATGDGKCPYLQPWDTAREMATTGNPDTRVLTFAVGFGLSTAAGIDCNTLACTDFVAGGTCEAPANSALAACCTLTRIACEGGTERAYFANDVGTLKSALSAILGQTTSEAKTRTIPAFASTSAAPGVQGNAGAVGYRFGAQFLTAQGSPLWVGQVLRERYVCDAPNGGVPKAIPQASDVTKGDNFGRNVNSNDPANPRKFFTVVREETSGKIHSVRSIRPKLALSGNDDGMGLQTGTTTGGGQPVVGLTFAGDLDDTPKALGIDPASVPAQCQSQLDTNDANECAARVIRWEVGEVDAGLPTRDVTGCTVTDPETGEPMGCELGSVYHSTPVVIGPPNEFLRDESYDQFAIEQSGRPTVLYVATTDGQLHAFKVSANRTTDSLKVDQLQNNELWSFLPPAVLPRLLTTYNQQSILLDGQVVVQDVVLERTGAQAIAGFGGGGPQWRTILLAGGGAGGGYYFALDVTDPTKPEFLWQISQDFEGAELFGPKVPTPAIATISMSENGGPAKDVGVAILAGGHDPLLTGTCPRSNATPAPVDGPVRSAVRCWAQGAGRTLSIVRLSTGEVIRTFHSPNAGMTTNLSAGRKTVAPFDSPLTGTPVPYPAKGGQITNRVYVGDADGTLWRVDLSKPNPADWTVDMMWDAYGTAGPEDGQPIETPPIVSIDPLGRPVLLFSTGDQETITTSSSATNHLFSILEDTSATPFKAVEKVHLTFTGGERVTGPVSLFDSTAYFATFLPSPPGSSAPGEACTFGEGKLWGVDYLTGDGRIDQPNSDAQFLSQGQNFIVSGLAITLTPSCADTANFDSPYFGSYTGVSGGSSGEYQLVYQVSGTSGAPQPGNESNVFKTKTLQPPRVTTRIDSWAAVVE